MLWFQVRSSNKTAFTRHKVNSSNLSSRLEAIRMSYDNSGTRRLNPSPGPPANKTPSPAARAPRAAGCNPGIPYAPYRPWSCSSARPGWLPIFGDSPGSSPSSSRTPAPRSCSVSEADLPLSAFNVSASVNFQREQVSSFLVPGTRNRGCGSCWSSCGSPS